MKDITNLQLQRGGLTVESLNTQIAQLFAFLQFAPYR